MTRKTFAKLVLPEETTDKCLEEGVSASTIMEELGGLDDSSQVGRMFAAKILRDAQQAVFRNVVKDTVGELPSDGPMAEILEANKVKFFQNCTAIGAMPTETQKAKTISLPSWM